MDSVKSIQQSQPWANSWLWGNGAELPNSPGFDQICQTLLPLMAIEAKPVINFGGKTFKKIELRYEDLLQPASAACNKHFNPHKKACISRLF